MRLLSALSLPALVLLVGCADAPATATADTAVGSATEAAPPTPNVAASAPEAATPDPEAAESHDWSGRYTFAEGGGPYTYASELVIAPAADGYAGSFSREGPQETRFYDVTARETDGRLAVVLSGFGAENVHEIPAVGETLFTLYWENTDTDPALVTSWDALTPTGVEGMSDEDGAAFGRDDAE